jgi:hypothetical protein
MGEDGKPGFISGAPDGLLLPAQSRVVQYQQIQLVTTRSLNGKRFTTSFTVQFDPDTMVVESGPEGMLIRQAHEVAVYAPGTIAYFGGSQQYGYFRPGTYRPPTQKEQAAKAGCVISYMDARGTIIREKTIASDCATVTLESLR